MRGKKLYRRPVIFLCMVMLYPAALLHAQEETFKPGTDTALINNTVRAAQKVNDDDSALTVYQQAVNQSLAAHYVRGARYCYTGMAYRYENKGDFAQALIYYGKAMDWCRTPKDTAEVYYRMGTDYSSTGDHATAVRYYFSSLDVLERNKADAPQLIAEVCENLGTTNLVLHQERDALFYIKKGEDVARKNNLYGELAGMLVCEGDYYANLKKFDSSIAVLTEALQLEVKINDSNRLSWAYVDLAGRYINTQQYQKAISFFETALAISKTRFNHLEVYFTASNGLAQVYYQLDDYQKARAILEPVLKTMIAENYRTNIAEVYSSLLAIYRQTGDYKKALDCMDSLTAQTDSALSMERTRDINQMQLKYKTAEKDREIAEGQLIIARQKNRIAQENTMATAATGGVMVLALLSVGIYRNSRHRHDRLAQQRKAGEPDKKIMSQEDIIGVLKAAVRGEDNERSRIARELHDGIGGMLSAAIIRLSAVHNENEAITGIASYNEAMKILRSMGDEIRKTAHNLMPEALLKQSLPEAVQSYCNIVQDATRLQIDFQSYGSFDELPENFKLNIYRIIQELLKNITQHAHASHAIVQLMNNKNTLGITVEDDGTGYDVDKPRNGIGLHNMQTRVSSLDGFMTTKSEPSTGTSVYIELPLPTSSKGPLNKLNV